MSKDHMSRAIRKYCRGCSGDSTKEVKLCVIDYCPLFPFRMGEDPFKKKLNLTDKERKERSARLNRKKTIASTSGSAQS